MTNQQKNFALIGAAGYVAPKHLEAIAANGHQLVAATDPHDSVGILDRYFRNVRFFPEIERFDRHLEKLRRDNEADRVHYIAVCSPNYLHDAHVRLALRLDAHAVCEKPLVIKPWNLDYLAKIEAESDAKVFTVLQLRLHPSLAALKRSLDGVSPKNRTRHQVVLTYITGRGGWYDVSWKGSDVHSGGIAMNIGVHFFDMLLWLFGEADTVEVHLKTSRRMAGFLSLKNADVRWFLSVDFDDLPHPKSAGMETTHRSITIDGQEIDFNTGFGNLHTKVYERILAGDGFGIEDARPSIELLHRIREATVSRTPNLPHPMLKMEQL